MLCWPTVCATGGSRFKQVLLPLLLMQEHYCLALGVLEQGSSWLSQALQLDQLAALMT
jgi:hypothetical protein